MPTRISTRFATFLLLAILALSLLIGIATRGTGTAGAHTQAAHSVAATAEDNDFPGSWTNHRVHLRPSSTHAGTFALSVSGNGLPHGATLTLYADIAVRGGSDGGLDGTAVTVDSFGNFSAGPFTVTVIPGQYVIVAIDPASNHVYNAILTVSS